MGDAALVVVLVDPANLCVYGIARRRIVGRHVSVVVVSVCIGICFAGTSKECAGRNVVRPHDIAVLIQLERRGQITEIACAVHLVAVFVKLAVRVDGQPLGRGRANLAIVIVSCNNVRLRVVRVEEVLIPHRQRERLLRLRGRFGGEGGKGFLGGGRVCAKAGGSVEVGLGGVGVALHRVGLGTLDIHIRIVGGQFVNDKRQILDRGSGLVQLDIRLGAAKIGGFTAGIHPDSAAEHGNGLGVIAFGQVFFTHR